MEPIKLNTVSEWAGHFGDESLQSVTCTGTDKPEQSRDKTRTKHKPM